MRANSLITSIDKAVLRETLQLLNAAGACKQQRAQILAVKLVQRRINVLVLKDFHTSKGPKDEMLSDNAKRLRDIFETRVCIRKENVNRRILLKNTADGSLLGNVEVVESETISEHE